MPSRLDQLHAFLVDAPDDSFARYAIGLEYVAMEDFNRALCAFEDLLRRDPSYLATYYQLGQLYATLERWDDAERTYQEGIKVGREQQEHHTVSELQAALDELEDMR